MKTEETKNSRILMIVLLISILLMGLFSSANAQEEFDWDKKDQNIIFNIGSTADMAIQNADYWVIQYAGWDSYYDGNFDLATDQNDYDGWVIMTKKEYKKMVREDGIFQILFFQKEELVYEINVIPGRKAWQYFISVHSQDMVRVTRPLI